MKIYVKYGKDGLIEAVADSPRELSILTGKTAARIRSLCSKHSKGILKNSLYQTIDVEEDINDGAAEESIKMAQ